MCGSAFHDEAHGAFMTLPPYTRTREGETRQTGRGPQPCWLGLGVRKCPRKSQRSTSIDITGSVALVTGGNRGLGKAFVQALLDAGVQKIYVGARHLTAISDSHLQPLKLDITNPSDIAAAAAACQDVTLLINNAGVGGGGPLLAAPSMEGAREEIETNYLGTLAMCRAFAPILGRNGGRALVNIL